MSVFSFSAECHVQGENEYVGVGASEADSTVVTNGGIYVVVQFYPWFIFYFSLFQTHYHTLPYPKTKENKNLTKDKIEPQHIHVLSCVLWYIRTCIIAACFMQGSKLIFSFRSQLVTSRKSLVAILF